MAFLKVEEALDRILAGIKTLEGKPTPLSQLASRQVLATAVKANLTQPPFNSSAMDGYGVRFEDCSRLPIKLKIVGESAAGSRYHGKINQGEAVRIFTGAPVSNDVDTVIMQEMTQNSEDGYVTILETPEKNANIRPSGGVFKQGDVVLEAGHLLTPAAIALCAASGHATINAIRRPRIAILATGDELVSPGEIPGEDQIICSNSYGLAQIARNQGCDVIDLGIARDNENSIRAAIEKARAEKADILLTSGGVSVGDYDLVQQVLKQEGMTLDFWKIAMRPGKPLLFGDLPGAHPMKILGLPGNPVSSLVCAHLFLVPMLNKMAGRLSNEMVTQARLGAALPANGDRRHYIRARVEIDTDGKLLATPVKSQDSSLIHLLADAHCLIIQEPNTGPVAQFDICNIFKPDNNGL